MLNDGTLPSLVSESRVQPAQRKTGVDIGQDPRYGPASLEPGPSVQVSVIVDDAPRPQGKRKSPRPSQVLYVVECPARSFPQRHRSGYVVAPVTDSHEASASRLLAHGKQHTGSGPKEEVVLRIPGSDVRNAAEQLGSIHQEGLASASGALEYKQSDDRGRSPGRRPVRVQPHVLPGKTVLSPARGTPGLDERQTGLCFMGMHVRRGPLRQKMPQVGKVGVTKEHHPSFAKVCGACSMGMF